MFRPRQNASEETAFTDAAGDGQVASMALQDMFDNGQAQTRTAACRAATVIDAIKSLGEIRQVLVLDAGAVVPDSKSNAIVIRVAVDTDMATLGGMRQSVVDEIGKGTGQFIGMADGCQSGGHIPVDMLLMLCGLGVERSGQLIKEGIQ